MGTEYIITTDGELVHWGIRGMRWGVRRYQNKNGSLTAAGRKRYQAEEMKLKEREKVIKNQERTKAKLSKLNAKKAELDAREEALKTGKKPGNSDNSQKSSGAKGVKNLSDAELKDLTNRMILEKNYYDAQKSLSTANPPKVSKGKKFVDGLLNDVVVPAAKSVGKTWLENTLKDKLGLNEKDPLKRLESKYKKLEWETKIKDLQKSGTLKESKGPTWDDMIKEQQYLRDQKKTAEAQREYEKYLREQDDD